MGARAQKWVQMRRRVTREGTAPRYVSPHGSPFLRACKYFVGIVKIRDYSQSKQISHWA